MKNKFFKLQLLLIIFSMTYNTAIADNCFRFKNSNQIIKRYKQWEKFLTAMPQKELFDILIGVKDPPEAIRKEVKRQSECLISVIRKKLDSQGKKKPERNIISWIRGHNKQNSIWTRKYFFNIGYKFGIITDSTKQMCKGLIGKDESSWNPLNKSHEKCWKKYLSSEQLQIEILQTSSAPGISRHHWGTDIDLFDPDLSAENWKRGMKYGYIYELLKKIAPHYGYFQPYVSLKKRHNKGYLEERWHWSYYPIARVFLDIIYENQQAFELHLRKHWRNKKQFSYVEANWRNYVFGITPMNGF